MNMLRRIWRQLTGHSDRRDEVNAYWTVEGNLEGNLEFRQMELNLQKLKDLYYVRDKES